MSLVKRAISVVVKCRRKNEWTLVLRPSEILLKIRWLEALLGLSYSLGMLEPPFGLSILTF